MRRIRVERFEALEEETIEKIKKQLLVKLLLLCLFDRLQAYALVTLPSRRQREQTATVLGVPFTIAFTLRILGFQVLLVLR